MPVLIDDDDDENNDECCHNVNDCDCNNSVCSNNNSHICENNCEDNDCESNISVTCSSEILSGSPNLTDYIDLALLYNFNTNIVSNFDVISIPSVNIKYNDFMKITFSEQEINFGIYIIDSLFKTLNLSITNCLLNVYEEVNSINRNNMNPSLKINLIKEFSFQKLSNIIKKIESLNKHEFKTAIGSVKTLNDACCVKVRAKLFSQILQVGIELQFTFIVKNIPCYLIKTKSDSIEYNFCEINKPIHEYNIIVESSTGETGTTCATGETGTTGATGTTGETGSQI